jgi:hypothetical protein
MLFFFKNNATIFDEPFRGLAGDETGIWSDKSVDERMS